MVETGAGAVLPVYGHNWQNLTLLWLDFEPLREHGRGFDLSKDLPERGLAKFEIKLVDLGRQVSPLVFSLRDDVNGESEISRKDFAGAIGNENRDSTA